MKSFLLISNNSEGGGVYLDGKFPEGMKEYYRNKDFDLESSPRLKFGLIPYVMDLLSEKGYVFEQLSQVQQGDRDFVTTVLMSKEN